MGVLAENDLRKFKGGLEEIKKLCEKAFRQLEHVSRLFTNEQYLKGVPPEAIKQLREHGEALQRVALGMLDPKGPYIAFYRMALAAETSPETAMPYFRRAFGLDIGKESSDSVQADESKPPSKPLPPIPTNVPSDQSNAAQTTQSLGLWRSRRVHRPRPPS
jgi:hypothetical protein